MRVKARRPLSDRVASRNRYFSIAVSIVWLGDACAGSHCPQHLKLQTLVLTLRNIGQHKSVRY